MKKYLVVLLLLISTSCAFAIDIVPKVSLCLPGTFRSDYEVDLSLNIGGEVRVPLSKYFAVAAGFDYLITRNISMGTKAKKEEWGKDQYYTDQNFSMLPIYAGIIIFPLGDTGEYKPYIRIDGGYNIYFSISNGKNSSPGYYVAGGFGFELFERYIVELYASRYEAEDNDNNITYKNIFFKVGYKFTL